MTSEDKKIYIHYIQDISIFYNHLARNGKDECADLLSNIIKNTNKNKEHIDNMISILASVASVDVKYNDKTTTAYGNIYKYLKCCIRTNKLNKLNG